MEEQMTSGHRVRVALKRKGEQLPAREQLQANAALIQHDLNCLAYILKQRLNDDQAPVNELVKWAAGDSELPYMQTIASYVENEFDRVLLLLALEQQYPARLFHRLVKFESTGLRIQNDELGGFIHPQTLQFVPTVQTAYYLVHGSNNVQLAPALAHDLLGSRLLAEQVLSLTSRLAGDGYAGEPDLVPEMNRDFFHHLVYGRELRPDFGDDFPARKMTTTLEFDKQIFLRREARTELEVLAEKIKTMSAVREKSKRLASGLPVLFYGPPGTGKSLSACALANLSGMPVFRVDLAQIVSKYVGETEKKLARVFDRAEGKDWILYFDEADVLFGSRTGVGDAHDRYANLLTAYLLQRIEEYEGVCILATNYRNNIDVAMQRRFVQVIAFELPKHEERLRIWENGLEAGFAYQPGLNLRIMAQFEFTGAQIAMIIKNATMRSIAQGSVFIQGNDLKYFACMENAKQGLSSLIQPWPGEKINGFTPPVALENPVRRNVFYDVKEKFSIANVNLFST